jgi:peptidoglycan/LPS O-acetylase OafA/YrhL
MFIALDGTSIFVLAAALALLLVPLPPAAADGPALGWRPTSLPLGRRLFADLSDRILKEYCAPLRTSTRAPFWNNIQLMRVIAVYCIAYIHMPSVLAAVHVVPEVVEVLRFGTDTFLVVGGFLTAQVLSGSRKTGGAYLRDRIVRLAPVYAIFTVLAFLVQNYLMEGHHNSVPELLMSLAFIPYGPFPVLYPAWTLIVIVEFSVFVAIFHALSPGRGVYLASAFLVVLVALAKLAQVSHPTLQVYTNPILIDFALGVLAYHLATRAVLPLPMGAAVWLATTAIVLAVTLIMLRPFEWPGAPRLLALGLPAFLLVLGAITLERAGAFRASNLVNFLAKCSYCIYLTHWFVSIVSEKVIVAGGAPPEVAAIMLLTTPVVVTYVAMAAYLYVEAPLTRGLMRRVGRREGSG